MSPSPTKSIGIQTFSALFEVAPEIKITAAIGGVADHIWTISELLNAALGDGVTAIARASLQSLG